MIVSPPFSRGFRWAYNRSASGEIQPNPTLFPNGMAPLVAYVNSRGLKMGIYTARGSVTCLGRPGSNGYEAQDAQTYADWGVSVGCRLGFEQQNCGVACRARRCRACRFADSRCSDERNCRSVVRVFDVRALE